MNWNVCFGLKYARCVRSAFGPWTAGLDRRSLANEQSNTLLPSRSQAKWHKAVNHQQHHTAQHDVLDTATWILIFGRDDTEDICVCVCVHVFVCVCVSEYVRLKRAPNGWHIWLHVMKCVSSSCFFVSLSVTHAAGAVLQGRSQWEDGCPLTLWDRVFTPLLQLSHQIECCLFQQVRASELSGPRGAMPPKGNHEAHVAQSRSRGIYVQQLKCHQTAVSSTATATVAEFCFQVILSAGLLKDSIGLDRNILIKEEVSPGSHWNILYQNQKAKSLLWADSASGNCVWTCLSWW